MRITPYHQRMKNVSQYLRRILPTARAVCAMKKGAFCAVAAKILRYRYGVGKGGILVYLSEPATQQEYKRQLVVLPLKMRTTQSYHQGKIVKK